MSVEISNICRLYLLDQQNPEAVEDCVWQERRPSSSFTLLLSGEHKVKCGQGRNVDDSTGHDVSFHDVRVIHFHIFIKSI